MLCYCDYMWKEMKACRVGGAEHMRLPFDCPMDHVLDTPRWFEDGGFDGVGVREAEFLHHPRVPTNVSGSIARVSLPHGLNDRQVRAALAPHASAAIIELADVVDAFCGFEDPEAGRAFTKAANTLLHYRRSPFCYEDGLHVPGYSQCCKPRKEGDPFFPCKYGFDAPAPLAQCSGN